MNKSNLRLYTPIILVVILLLVSLACAESTSTDEPTINTATPETEEQPEQLETELIEEIPTNAPEPTEPLPTDTPEPEPTYLGDVVEKQGYLISAVAVEDPAPPGMFYEPETGKKLVAVEVIIGVNTGDPISINPLDAILVDSEGFSYQLELGGHDEQLATTELFTGEKLRGWLAFQIPDEAIPAKVKYEIESFSNNFMEANLETPPDGYVPNTELLSINPPEPQAKLGDSYENFGYSLTAFSVEDPATPGMFYDPKVGYKLVAVDIAIGNESGEYLSVNPLDARLVDSNGYVYTPELGGRDDQIATIDIGPGEKTRGWVAFTIQENASPYIIKYQVDMFTFNYLQTGVTE